jgi:uncharacterized membrane protein YdjX (TVP38/TMEM64 family)
MSVQTPAPSRHAAAAGIDPRGPQLAAAVTAAVLVAVLVLPQSAATVLTAVQAVLFGLGAGVWTDMTLLRTC